MRVVWILESGGLAGGVKVIYEFAKRLTYKDLTVEIASLGSQSKWFAFDGRVKWVKYESYEQLVVGVSASKPDAVIATWWRTLYAAKDIQEASKCKLFYFVQDLESSYYLEPVQIAAVMESYTLGATHFAPNKWVCEMIPNCTYVGIAIGNSWRPDPNIKRQRTVLALLRRQALKGFRELCEVARYLSWGGEGGGDVIYQTPPTQTSSGSPLYQSSRRSPIGLQTFGMDLVQISGSHTPVSKIDSMGQQVMLRDKDINRLYNSAGVFISCSLHEGWCIPIVEAMSTGTPVVTFDAGGNMEYCVDGENCLIATSPLDMYQKVCQVLDDRALANRLSKAGLLTAAQYRDWDGPVQRLSALLNEA